MLLERGHCLTPLPLGNTLPFNNRAILRPGTLDGVSSQASYSRGPHNLQTSLREDPSRGLITSVHTTTKTEPHHLLA